MVDKISVKGGEIVFLRGNSQQGVLRCNSKGLLFKPKGSQFEEYLSNYKPSWNQIGNDIDGEAAGDKSGYSISTNNNGTIIAIGAIHNDGNGLNSGHTRVYKWNDGWFQLGNDIDGEAAEDFSGYSVSLSDDGLVLAIGAIFNDGSGSNSGHTRVFEWSNNNEWVKRGDDIDGEAEGDLSGYSVSLNNNGSIVAIGAIHNDGGGTFSGQTRIFEWMSNAWSQQGDDIDGETLLDFFGYQISLSYDGTMIAIGSIPVNLPNLTRFARVQLYSFQNGFWSKNGSSIELPDILSISENDDINIFSFSMNMIASDDSAFIAIGSATEMSTNGVAQIYEFYQGNWSQRGNNIYGIHDNDLNGFSVNICNNGDTVAISAIQNDGANETDTNIGHVRIYDWKINQWDQRGDDIYGEAIEDKSGYSVAMDSDGDIVFISSINNNNDQGHVRAFLFE